MGASAAQAEQRRTASIADTWPAVLLLLPALLLLRYAGEHSWAYWTGAVIGLFGLTGAAFEITAAVKHLAKRRKPWVAVWALLVLMAASVHLVLRLAERW
ncbi:hypothetical protein [Streptomyces sp. NBC_00259]|uniref:hypothetical protein n=1 Tax=Streptomyces sp. NBC_00259 TaxID=2903643 RepID=UPI002E284041|nr:hypothetical protein [Streptomyces sp. NBC_00259]